MISSRGGSARGAANAEPMTLDEDIIESGLCNLGKSPLLSHTFLNVVLQNRKLVDISILGSYIHLQNVDLSYNRLTDISALASLSFLRTLVLAHNNLSVLLDFGNKVNPLTQTQLLPTALHYIDYSHNQLVNLGSNLHSHKYIQHINVSHNSIATFSGLYSLQYLATFDAQHNQIKDVSTINNPRLSQLNLSFNQISDLSNLKYLPFLRHLDVSSNKINNLNGLQKQKLLVTLRMADNLVAEVEQLINFFYLEHLRELDLSGNPVQNTPDYRQKVLYILPRLVRLDGVDVTAEEVVFAANMHSEDRAEREGILLQYLPFLEESTPDNVNVHMDRFTPIESRPGTTDELSDDDTRGPDQPLAHTSAAAQPGLKLVTIPEIEAALRPLVCPLVHDVYGGRTAREITRAIKEGKAAMAQAQARHGVQSKYQHEFLKFDRKVLAPKRFWGVIGQRITLITFITLLR